MTPKAIIKRDGRTVEFEPVKVTAAVRKAFGATGEPGDAAEVTRRVLGRLSREGVAAPTVEQVQDMVEEALMEMGSYRTAKAYILYREQRRQVREMKAWVSQDVIDRYIAELDWRVRENANVGFNIQGLHLYIVGSMAAPYWLQKIFPPEVQEMHRSGDLHLHDLGFLGNYCCGWDLQALFREGFNGVPGMVEAAPPKHFRSALGQVYNFLYTLQNESAGAQAFSSVDTLLAPFVREDRLSYGEVLQAVQESVFNLNTQTRLGLQVPFTNVTFDVLSSGYDREPAVVGGREMPYSYGDCAEERLAVVRAVCEVMLRGDCRERTFTFPVPTFNVTPEWGGGDVPGEVWELTAKYGAPYFANFIGSDMSPRDVRSMCCRLRLETSELLKRGGGLFGANPLTGSCGVVTLNLPRLAYLAEDEDDFFARLARLASVAVTALEVKRKALERFADRGLYPYSARYLRGVKERFGAYYANHFSTVGVVGGNEMCLNLLGAPITSPEGKAFARRVLEFLREFCRAAQQRTGNLYNLEATPAEGCSYRLARIDKAKFPKILVANEGAVARGEEPYYTNSTHPPASWTDDPFELLEHQEELQALYTGGTVVHFWLGEERPDPGACREFVLRVFSTSRVPYVTLTPTFSVCPAHGYTPGAHAACPRCGAECEVWSRVTGYYRPVAGYNPGKQAEFRDRKTFRLGGVRR